jgi:DNA repair exonuclease SbcCD ATPase subunit
MEQETAALHEQIAALNGQLLAAQSDRDASVRTSDDLKRQLSASSAATKELGAKLDAANADIERQARQLGALVAASDAAAKASAAMQARLQAELHASQKTLSDSQEALSRATSELQRERETAAAALAAAATQSKELQKQVRALEARLAEAEQHKSRPEADDQRQNVRGRQSLDAIRKENSPARQHSGHAVGGVLVGLPQHHHEKPKSLPDETDSSLLPKRRISDTAPRISPGASLSIDLPLTPALAALVSSANLPPREPGLTRARSSGRLGQDGSVSQVCF